MLIENPATREALFVSIKSQLNAMIEVSGRATKMPPAKTERFEISEAAVSRNAETANFTKNRTEKVTI